MPIDPVQMRIAVVKKQFMETAAEEYMSNALRPLQSSSMLERK